jgi:hypothetical protein
MIFDPLGGMAPPQAIDVKTEKNPDIKETRPIENSNKSDDTKFDNERQNIGQKHTTKYIVDTGRVELVTYDSKGNVVGKVPPG